MDVHVEQIGAPPGVGVPPACWGESAASTVASDQGAGALGFAGTAHREADIAAAGLATLAGDEFGGGPSVPMVSRTWEPDQRERGEGDHR